MFNQSTTGGPIGAQSFAEGTPVFDVTGEKVGTVSTPDTQQAGCLTVQKGWLFPHELYVPFNYITSQDARGIFLSLSKDELKNDQWKTPSSAPTMAASAPAQPEPYIPQQSGPGDDWGAQSDIGLHPLDQPPSTSAGPDWGKQSDSELNP